MAINNYIDGYVNNTVVTDSVTTSIMGYTNGLPQDSLLQSTIKKQVESVDKISLATSIFKKTVNIGEAIVEFASQTGIAGFKFHLPKREQVKFQSDVTDHYTDLNNPVQDHIARKPVTITMNGLQGEYFYSVNKIEDAIATIVPVLACVKEFLPKLPDSVKDSLAKKYSDLSGKPLSKTPEALRTTEARKDLSGIDLFNLYQDLYKLKSAQTRAFLFFEALWQSEATFTVETTWKRYNNMIVTDVTPLRDENADITDITVTFKQMQFTSSLVRDLDNAAGRTREQLSEEVDQGTDAFQSSITDEQMAEWDAQRKEREAAAAYENAKMDMDGEWFI